MASAQFRRLSLRIEEASFVEGAKDVVSSVRHDWPRESLQVVVFTQGITNKLVGVHIGKANDMLLVRVYGHKSELLIDRDREIKTILLLQRHGCCAPLHATFENGLCYGYVPGRPLDVNTVRQPKIARLVVQAMVGQHSIRTEESPQPCLFTMLRKWIGIIPRSFRDGEQQKRFVANVPSMDLLEQELDVLEDRLTKLNSPVVFCHNDILIGNVIHNEEKGSASLIDFEYAGYNYRGFDIGNHFCEYAGMDDIDYGRYPSRDYQKQWLRWYLEATSKKNGSDDTVPDSDVHELFVEVNQFALASHFFWFLWALIQAANSDLPFDFMGYAIVRLDEYMSRKAEFFGLSS